MYIDVDNEKLLIKKILNEIFIFVNNNLITRMTLRKIIKLRNTSIRGTVANTIRIKKFMELLACNINLNLFHHRK